MKTNGINNEPTPPLIEGIITITIASEVIGTYLAKSYPIATGKAYEVPVYRVIITSTAYPDKILCDIMTLRFMPTKLAIESNVFMSGLADYKIFDTTVYNPKYNPHNHDVSTFYRGSFSLYGNFLIHAGPLDLKDYGWGAKGCIEIFEFFEFKNKIWSMAGKVDRSLLLEELLVYLCESNRIRIVIEKANRPPVKEVDPPSGEESKFW